MDKILTKSTNEYLRKYMMLVKKMLESDLLKNYATIDSCDEISEIGKPQVKKILQDALHLTVFSMFVKMDQPPFAGRMKLSVELDDGSIIELVADEDYHDERAKLANDT